MVRSLPLLVANLLRRKLRTALSVGSFAVALFLFGLLVAIRGGFSQGVEAAGADRLVVINKTSLIQPLPKAYRDRLARVPGVRLVYFASWFGGVYRDERNFFPQFAVDPETHLEMYSEFRVPEAQWRDFLADKQGCIAGAATARRFGWKLGDRIPIKGAIFPGAWEFNLRGIYAGTRPQDDETQFWFRDDYLKERAPQWFDGYVGWYVVRVEHPDAAVAVAKAIDEGFANSPWETRSSSEKAFAAEFVRQFGNIELLILVVGSVVFFTLLLVTANTMGIAVRERTSELAILKAVGFSDAGVLALVLAEALTVAGAGGGLGLALAWLFIRRGDPSGGFLPAFVLPARGIAAGVVVTLAVGLLAAAAPALSAMRLRVATALRRV